MQQSRVLIFTVSVNVQSRVAVPSTLLRARRCCVHRVNARVDNIIGDAGAAALAEALTISPTLTQFGIYCACDAGTQRLAVKERNAVLAPRARCGVARGGCGREPHWFHGCYGNCGRSEGQRDSGAY